MYVCLCMDEESYRYSQSKNVVLRKSYDMDIENDGFVELFSVSFFYF